MSSKIILIIVAILCLNCSTSKNSPSEKLHEIMNFTEITSLLSYDEFETIKKFILEKGDRRTYRNFDNSNPHYTFKEIDIFLGAVIGQKNLNNDTEISDYNEMTIVDWTSSIRYHTLIIVRKNNVKKGKKFVTEGMKENRVYLVDFYGNELALMEKNLAGYLKQIKEEIKAD